MRLDVCLGEVLKQLSEHDVNLRYILAKGEWRTIFTKKDFAVIKDDIHKRTLVIQIRTIPIYNKNMEVKYYNKEIEWFIIHKPLSTIDIEKLYKKFKKSKIKMLSIRTNKHRIKLSRKCKKLTDKQRLKINVEKQRQVEEKLRELKEEYDKIKYRRKEPYRSRKRKIKELIKNYERLLKELKEVENELRAKLKTEIVEIDENL